MRVSTKYAAPAATILLAAIAALLFILLVNDDAEQNENPVPAVSPTVPVGPTELVPTPDLGATVQAANDSATATAEAQATPTSAPSATATVAPTVEATATATPTATLTPEPTRPPIPTAVPTATPFPPIDVPEFTAPASDAAVSFPVGLLPASEPMSHEDVVQAWTDSLTRKRVQIVGVQGHGVIGPIDLGIMELALCPGGRGFIVEVGRVQDPGLIGHVFTWEITHSIANQWFAPTLRVSPSDNSIDPDLAFSGGLTGGGGNNPGQGSYGYPLSFDEDRAVVGERRFQMVLFEMEDSTGICALIP